MSDYLVFVLSKSPAGGTEDFFCVAEDLPAAKSKAEDAMRDFGMSRAHVARFESGNLVIVSRFNREVGWQDARQGEG